MNVTIEQCDQISLPGMGVLTGEIVVCLGCDGDYWTPPEPPGLESGTLRTEDGEEIDVESIIEDGIVYHLLMEQLVGLPCFAEPEQSDWLAQ